MAHMVPIYAAIAASQQKKKQEEEESLMAEFMNEDKSGNWEYKIIRGTLGAFRSEERMYRALASESQASWELAMKLDDERLVLRRPRRASMQDTNLEPGVRPYRTDYGGKTIKLVIALLLLVLGVAAFAFSLFASGDVFPGGSSVIMMGIVGLMLVLGLFVVFMKLRR